MLPGEYLRIGGLAAVLAGLGLIGFLWQRGEMWQARWESCNSQRAQVQAGADELAREVEELNQRVQASLARAEQLAKAAQEADAVNAEVAQDYESKIAALQAKRPKENSTELELCEQGRQLGTR